MSTTDHSMVSTYEKNILLEHATTGVHKVKYQADDDWDFHMDSPHKDIDMSLVLPHYRARHQPVDHRMSMFVGSDARHMKLKICRTFPRSKFYLEVQAETSDITVWLPSDFSGQIHHSNRVSYSAGFINRIMQRARINEPRHEENPAEDEVVVYTRGHITFRMWDIQRCAPENTQKEAIKRMFGCARKAPETTINWDFLLED